MTFEYINIIGYGYVGSAIGYLCKRNDVEFCTYDVVRKEEERAICNYDDIQQMVTDSERKNEVNIYVVAVPTPAGANGECNTQIVESVLSDLVRICSKKTCVVLKSTVKPGTCSMLYERYIQNSDILSFTYCPEFLKEKTFQDDMYSAEFVLLGSKDAGTNDDGGNCESLMRKLYKHNESILIIRRSYEECEMFKYTINVYLSVKVWFFNEVSILSKALGVEYHKLQDLFDLEPRLGESHMDVPGHDGKCGFGGKCLPKETKAMSNLQCELGLDNSVLERILKRNFEMRGSDY